MIALVIKIALGIFACVVALLGVLDYKTVIPPEDAVGVPWRKRFTRAGIAKIICALATLGLLAANELIGYRASAQASALAEKNASELKSQLTAVRTKFTESRDALAANILKLNSVARTNQYLVTTLDTSLVLAGISRVPVHDIDKAYVPLRFNDGKSLIPKRGDIFQWSFACQTGPLPPIPTAQQDGSCSQVAYGRLMANGYPVLLSEENGQRPYFGSRSTGEQLSYRSPAEGGLCPSMAAQLKKMNCQLEITVMRQARWKFEQLSKNGAKSSSLADQTQDACREYEAIFGKSCDSIIADQSKH